MQGSVFFAKRQGALPADVCGPPEDVQPAPLDADPAVGPAWPAPRSVSVRPHCPLSVGSPRCPLTEPGPLPETAQGFGLFHFID